LESRIFVGWLRSYWVELMLVAFLMLAVGYFGYLGYGLVDAQTLEDDFAGEDALADVASQMELGPRIVGTGPSEQAQEWLAREMQRADWYPLYQPFLLPVPQEAMPASTVFSTTVTTNMPVVIGRNIIAASTPDIDADLPVVWLISRYDTRVWADEDPMPSNQQMPVPGANAGASGPATLLELARKLDRQITGYRFCMILLDGEANRGLPGWSDLTGIDYYLRGQASVTACQTPEFAVVLDVIGGENQQIFIERNSDSALSAAIWSVADQLGFGDFIVSEPKWAIEGAHNALLAEGIPTVTLIDHDYAYLRTVEDTIDKLSPDSFARIGETLLTWLEAGAPYSGKP
jgi:glutaminyl-peptide cyclotransferase